MPRKTTKRSIPGKPSVRVLQVSLAGNVEDLRAAKQEWFSRLLQRQAMPASRALTAAITPDPALNLMGVGIGEKLVDRRCTGILAVKFLVRAKYHESHISQKHILPKSISGLPTDVEEVGLFRALGAGAATVTAPNPRTRIRPAPPGCSVGFADPNGQFVMAGTFGALVKDANGSYILSNNHVLADEGQLPAGSPIFQPGLLDGGNQSTDQIAKLTKFVPLQPNVSNQVDCAIAAVLKSSDVSNSILQIGPPQGTGNAQIDMSVQKFGRTTGYTAGRVTSVDTDVTVQYETGNFTFGGQIIVVGLDGQAFSGAGDSGSLIVERTSNLAVGLLFAGSSTHTIANHINDDLQALGVTLA
ncbi:MAG TPA: hypothetical protein VEI01_24440 [Terriglobales bacterium]|nr:hypothetical protein [Terriglobales bacterium]